jgi:hypothetical protein
MDAAARRIKEGALPVLFIRLFSVNLGCRILTGSHARKWYGSYSHKAIHYVVKVKIGGVTGLVVRLVGKQPPRHASMGARR